MTSNVRIERARRALKAATPPAAWHLFSRARQAMRRDAIRISGGYASWDEAMAAAGGYDEPGILDRVVSAARKARDGEVAFERDGVVFAEPEASFPLLYALARAGARDGRINVLDFGGSLGSSYFQNRAFLAGTAPLRWAVVEQANFVEAGKREFTNHELSFHETIEAACADESYNVLLLSSVLDYLPDPTNFLARALAHQFRVVIIDRTPFVSDGGPKRLMLQRVPHQIYAASYPVWMLDLSLLNTLQERYRLVTSWPALDKVQPEGVRVEWRGFLFELAEAAPRPAEGAVPARDGA